MIEIILNTVFMFLSIVYGLTWIGRLIVGQKIYTAQTMLFALGLTGLIILNFFM